DVASRLADLYRQNNMTKDAIQIHIEMAEQFTKKGLLKRALEEFAQVVELDPKNLKNKVKLADLYNKEGMKERAASIYLEVAEALAIEQMHSEAYQILERAKTMTSAPQVFLTQSRLCVIQKDLAGALAHLREGLAANPRSPEILEALAEVEIQSRNPDKALEALGQIPQLPEKSMALCERALREMAKAGRGDEGLQLFKPLGREFARRGLGEIAAKALRNAMQSFFTAEAWLQLAEIAHHCGNKQERIDALRRAREEASITGDDDLAASVLEQLKSLGITDEQMSAPPVAIVSRLQVPEPTETFAGYEHTEIDPVRRMQIQQLQRDAENFVRARFMDKAQEAFARILDLDPMNQDAIYRIADIIRASGKMTAVQMHFVKTAEKLAAMGAKEMALEMLD
ncbi:MAG TPA: tetratricopeptide repeat protein, partial [Holophaga sp.]|nr:tetratricopeptide repeat protein [Holophaga sp.]